ncbi:3609_t:CDS:2 [Racocetra fulgida]|uniref:3609_t:CDS:1 n=1 Tax=Racocetra fulgida TaxID=60492 RepID=A0A9N8YYG2_9GLOM|nr:3609_t:CDS:2 [Racocetra fulgida]
MGKRKTKQEVDEGKDGGLPYFSNENELIEKKEHANIDTQVDKTGENTGNNEIKKDTTKQTTEEDGGKASSTTEKVYLLLRAHFTFEIRNIKNLKIISKATTESSSEDELSDTTGNFQTMVSKAKGRWTVEDDKLLSNLVLAHLPEVGWSNIARENFPERNRSSLYNRWNVIKKRLWNGVESKGEDNSYTVNS